jgi:ferrochelatase
MHLRKKMAVILAAHGEAETAGFIENYKVSRHTLEHASRVMPIPLLLQRFISLSSSFKKKLHPGLSVEGSPHNQLTRELAALLQQLLDRCPASAEVVFEVSAAFSSSEPYFETIIEQTRNYDGQIIVSMSPIDNSLSCGLLCDYLSGIYLADELHKVKVISRFWRDDILYRIYTEHLFDNSVEISDVEKDSNTLILLFHGTLVKDRKGDQPGFRTGLEETAAFAQKLQTSIIRDQRNPYGRVMTAYLNHDVGGQWTRPSFEEICVRFSESATRNASVFAAGYFADGNETLYRRGEFARLAPACQVRAIPCFNASDAFAGYLASRVASAATQIMCYS